MTIVPTFASKQALIIHRRDEGIDRLSRQLGLLGMSVETRWAPLEESEMSFDLVLVDADQGWDGLLPWKPGHPPMPLIALLQSEAPGRIAWVLDQGACGLIAKPIMPSAVYPALGMAFNLYQNRKREASQMARLEERVKLRPLVHAAVQAIQVSRSLGEETAYDLLRRLAMTLADCFPLPKPLSPLSLSY